MEARAQARYIRVTPMKARRVVDPDSYWAACCEARAILRYAPPVRSDRSARCSRAPSPTPPTTGADVNSW